jgi:hypothetical protein
LLDDAFIKVTTQNAAAMTAVGLVFTAGYVSPTRIWD